MPILASFYIFLSLLEGKTESFAALTEECRLKLGTTLFARYCFMVPTQVSDELDILDLVQLTLELSAHYRCES